jgi:hypothetical protein
MRTLSGAAIAACLMSGAGTAQAAPWAEIRDAAVRVTVIPEARPDVLVSVVKTNPKLPIWISREGDKVIVRGDVSHNINHCNTWMGRPSVGIWLRGQFGPDDLPQIVIRTPPDVHVVAGEAAFGSIGHARSVDFGGHGCGDWTIADVDGPLRLGLVGSGDVHAGSAASGEVNIAGSGDVTAQTFRSGLSTAISGSGDFTAASANGALSVRVAGSGDVKIPAGRVSTLSVSVAGSGDVRFGGVADSLQANVAGSGDVFVAKVTGPVVKHVGGSGEVQVGH